jgi:predicted O-methyltransferase YrrM
MPLPKAVRRLAPDRIRNSVPLRALAVGSGVIPPRTMHSLEEAALLARLAAGRRTAVEIGVYEGSSALVLCGALPVDAVLHLVDPFTGNALRPGWRATEAATRRVVERAVKRRGGPRITWHPVTSEEAAAGWAAPVDVVFIDGDHTEAGCRLDWQLWSPWVASGGAVAFHDAREGRPGGHGLPGPTRVVDSLFRGGGAIEGWRIAVEEGSAVAVERLGARPDGGEGSR